MPSISSVSTLSLRLYDFVDMTLPSSISPDSPFSSSLSILMSLDVLSTSSTAFPTHWYTVTDEAVMAEILQGGIPSLLKQVEAGVSVGALRSKNGSSLLHEAVSASQEELAKYLVENKIVEANAVNDVVCERE